MQRENLGLRRCGDSWVGLLSKISPVIAILLLFFGLSSLIYNSNVILSCSIFSTQDGGFEAKQHQAASCPVCSSLVINSEKQSLKQAHSKLGRFRHTWAAPVGCWSLARWGVFRPGIFEWLRDLVACSESETNDHKVLEVFNEAAVKYYFFYSFGAGIESPASLYVGCYKNYLIRYEVCTVTLSLSATINNTLYLRGPSILDLHSLAYML